MINLSDSTDPELGTAAAVIRSVAVAAAKQKVDFMIVGAMARNIVSFELVSHAPTRTTNDIDIAIAVNSWDEFNDLSRELTPHDQPRQRQPQQRFRVLGIPVDVVPFGGIESAERTIQWQDETEMNVLGLREAWAQAEAVLLPGGVPARVPTIPAQAILKMIAWRERHMANSKDAIDLATIVDWYSTGSFLELLYDQHFDLVEVNGHSPDLAAAHRLGQDMAETLDRQSFETFSRTLDDEPLMSRLANDMRQSTPTSAAKIAALRAGFLASAPR